MAAANEQYINIDKVAQLKGLKNNRSLRVEINKENSKYKARKVKTQGGYTYEILFSTYRFLLSLNRLQHLLDFDIQDQKNIQRRVPEFL